MIYIGIDVGKKGGVAIIFKDGVCAYPWDDERFIQTMDVAAHMDDNCIACVEQVHAMPKQGVSSTFAFGKAAGFIEGVLTANRIPFQLVPPKKWKKEYSLGNDKNQSIAVCKKLFPNVSLLPTARCTKDSDGMAEALLMAEYARRHF